MKILLFTVGAYTFLVSCSSNTVDTPLKLSNQDLTEKYLTAQVINQQHNENHLPAWLKEGESACETKNNTYCAIECVVVAGDDYFLDQRYANNLAKAKVLGYLKTAMRLYDESLQAKRGDIQSREAGNYVDAVVKGYSYGIRTPKTAYRNTLDRLEVCSKAVFNPQQADNLISEFARISDLSLDIKRLQADKKLFLSHSFRERVKARFAEENLSDVSND